MHDMVKAEEPVTPENLSSHIDARIREAKRCMGIDSIYAGFERKFSSTDGYRDEFGFGNNSSIITLRYLYYAAKLASLYLVKGINSLRIKK
jgi:hypothetical protein